MIDFQRRYYLYRLVLSFASGVSLASAFAPANEPIYALAGLLIIFYLVGITQKVKDAFLWGIAFGFGWFVVGVNWVYFSMYHYGYMPLEWTYVTTCVFALGLGLFPAAAFAIATRLTENAALRMAFTIPAAFTLTEWIRSWFLTGFPWLNPAYAVIDWPIAGIAPILGSFGVLLALTWIAGLLAAFWVLRGQWIYMGACAIMAFSLLFLGMVGDRVPWSESAGTLKVRLIQPNLEPRLLQQSMSERFDEVYFYLDNVSVEKPDIDLVILPESVYPISVQRMPQEMNRLTEWVKKEKKGLLFNAFWEPQAGDFRNAAIHLTPNGELSVYEKRHLVPFGEFVPWGFHWFVESMRIPMSDLTAGADTQPLMNLSGHPASVNLCYENLFGNEWRDAWHEGSPELLVNLSNLKWFGPYKAASQHLQISRMRAKESARPLLNVTNSGVTALVDARGQVLESLPSDESALRDVTVVTAKGEATPYIRMGDWPALLWAFAMFVVGVALSVFLKRRQNV